MSFINPPAVPEYSDKNSTRFEVNFVELTFKRLNLTAEFIVSPNMKNFYLRMFVLTVGKL